MSCWYRPIAFARFAVLGAVALVSPLTLHGQGQGSKPLQDVAVINTPDVKVVNVPTVSVANAISLVNGSTVGIDPESNTVTIDTSSPVVVREANTVLVASYHVSPQAQPYVVGPLDVSAFARLRVVVIFHGSGNGSVAARLTLPNAAVIPFGEPVELASADDLRYGTKVYEFPGPSLGFTVQFFSPNGYCQIVIYGRSN
jgi:hypothetical protein